MRPALLHGSAPSPLVLTFLRAQVRSAFDTPVAQCAGIRKHQKGYRTTVIYPSDKRGKSGSIGSRILQRGESLCGRGLVNEACVLQQRLAQPNSDGRRFPARQCASSFHRNFSTTRRFQAWGIFKSAKTRRLSGHPAPDDHPTGPSGFGSSLGRMTRAANELKMRCTELDEHGNVTLVSGEFKKSELIAKVLSLTTYPLGMMS